MHMNIKRSTLGILSLFVTILLEIASVDVRLTAVSLSAGWPQERRKGVFPPVKPAGPRAVLLFVRKLN